MPLYRLSAFSEGSAGGNPAGVHVSDRLPERAEMQRIARAVGYSETAFAAPAEGGWIVRYFSPEEEVAFCGHATIALGAQLARLHGPGRFDLSLSGAEISVTATADGAALISPPTSSRPMPPALLHQLLGLFGLGSGDLDPRIPPSLANGGVDHGILVLRDRKRLATMEYPFAQMQALVMAERLVTISLLTIEGPDLFLARNAFAFGGVVEDPATGAAAAALGGLLVDLGWPLPGNRFTILQGQDMGAPSRLEVEVTGRPGDPVTVSGTIRAIG